MKPESVKRWALLSLLGLLLLVPGWASAQVAFGRIVVFGTSLSDPGNFFVLTGQKSTPPYETLDPFLVPSAPYARGGHHFSNGATWIEQFARPLGLAGSVRPAFQNENTQATNYAVGGARARDVGITVNLSTQVDVFLSDFGGEAPSDGLYVIEIGTNDIRDALAALAAGGDASAIISAALVAIGEEIAVLYESGGTQFLVSNVPNLRLVPAIRLLDAFNPGAAATAEFLTQSFNSGLDTLLLGLLAELAGIEITLLDVYQKVNDLIEDPEAFGLGDVESACLTPGLPPFTCQVPDEFLFWDGIHPTKAVHSIFAQEAAIVIAEQRAISVMAKCYSEPFDMDDDFNCFALNIEGGSLPVRVKAANP